MKTKLKKRCRLTKPGKKSFLMQQLGKRNMWMLQLSFWLEFALEATDLEVGHKETEVLERDWKRQEQGESEKVRAGRGAADDDVVPGKQLREGEGERFGTIGHALHRVCELVLLWRDVWHC